MKERERKSEEKELNVRKKVDYSTLLEQFKLYTQMKTHFRFNKSIQCSVPSVRQSNRWNSYTRLGVEGIHHFLVIFGNYHKLTLCCVSLY